MGFNIFSLSFTDLLIKFMKIQAKSGGSHTWRRTTIISLVLKQFFHSSCWRDLKESYLSDHRFPPPLLRALQLHARHESLTSYWIRYLKKLRGPISVDFFENEPSSIKWIRYGWSFQLPSVMSYRVSIQPSLASDPLQ